jgi:antitoxin YefM
VANKEIQIVSSESGEPTAVIVPIDLSREIESERETAYLLKSETMKDRLLQASRRLRRWGNCSTCLFEKPNGARLVRAKPC